MDYKEIKIKIDKRELDKLILLLSDMGIDDIAIEDPDDVRELMEKPVEWAWDYVADEVQEKANEKPVVTVYMEDTPEQDSIVDKIKKNTESLNPEISISELKAEAWQDKWKEYFKPAKITEKIVIKPTWEEYESSDGSEIIVEIDPGMAFGTGTHETTSLCIKLLEKYAEKEKKVLDVGCGSGILSIVAAKLGMTDILALDIDPTAVDVSRENAIINGVEKYINFQISDLTKGIDYQGDIVLANLMTDLVIMLSKDVKKHIKKEGIFISSGILTEKREMVEAAIREAGFEILETAEDGEWCAIAAKA